MFRVKPLRSSALAFLIGIWLISFQLGIRLLPLDVHDATSMVPIENAVLTKTQEHSREERIRLFIITVTSHRRIDKALLTHKICSHLASPFDRFTYICDVGCEANKNVTSQLPNVTELDSRLVSSIKRNRTAETKRSSFEYRLAQLKFYFGLVHHVRHFHATRGPMPEWFLLKDDDSYVHADRLMKVVQGVDFTKERVSVAGGRRSLENIYPPDIPIMNGPPMPGCAWPDGGGGWLISRAQAETLALEHGDRLLEYMSRKIVSPFYHYDLWIPEIASWGGGKLYHSPAIANIDEWVPVGNDPCPDDNITLASVHMKRVLGFRGLVRGLSTMVNCFRKPFVLEEKLKDRIAETKASTATNVTHCHSKVEAKD